MLPVHQVCVFCGSSEGVAPHFRRAASELGGALARAGIGVVFGGGRVGLMGLLADAALAAGGAVTGIIPARLVAAEMAHSGRGELVIVDSRHARKREMAARADAFAVLPGGLGTLDETFEIITWKQLGLHDKPILILDLAGYWMPLLALLGHVVTNGFAPAPIGDLIRVVSNVAKAMAALTETPAPSAPSPPLGGDPADQDKGLKQREKWPSPGDMHEAWG